MGRFYIIFFFFSFFFHYFAYGESMVTRLPEFSGTFYPKDPIVLDKMLTQMLNQVQTIALQNSKNIKALILPHAGYMYSGQTGSIGYNLLKNQDIETIILIGPLHAHLFQGASIWSTGSWLTPLGGIQINDDMAYSIWKENTLFRAPSSLHLKEHSLEVHIPFIQKILPHAKIVPILINDIKAVKDLAKTLKSIVAQEKVIVIASTDMSHYHEAKKAEHIDQNTLKMLQDSFQHNDLSVLYQKIVDGTIQLCGDAAVLTVLELSKMMGWQNLKILDYRHSGNVTEDKTSVVGYSAIGLFQQDESLTQSQKQILLRLARQSLDAFLTQKKKPSFEIMDVALKVKRAVFVTLLNKDDSLRGCIGRLIPEESLDKAVAHMAIEAATEDSRFSPVKAAELKDLVIEISILNLPQKITDIKEIIVGTHGVIISQGNKKGVFLPEVWESLRTKDEFLSELCEQKAGLSRNCWQDKKTNIEVFTTTHFSEQKKTDN